MSYEKQQHIQPWIIQHSPDLSVAKQTRKLAYKAVEL